MTRKLMLASAMLLAAGCNIREALIRAGLPPNRIVDGTLGDVNLRRNRRVEVLLKTARLTQAR